MPHTGPSFLEDATLKTPPKNNEIELTVFGRGFGECIVLHCGNNEFVVVDSFLNSKTRNPIALDYLDAIGLSYSSIKEVIITHWHQDHISGISTIINNASSNVKVVLSPIVKEKKFNEWLCGGLQMKSTNTKEFEKVMSFIRTNKKCIRFAGQSKRTYSNDELGNTSIYSLSPQDEEIYSYLNKLILPEYGQEISYDLTNDNLLSIVLMMETKNGDGILLGGDMENRDDESIGWEAVINNYEYSNIKSSVFKVPHHGSETGHNEKIWQELLGPSPISIITCFNKSGQLPKEEDILRIKALSKAVYIIGKDMKKDKELMRVAQKRNMDVKVLTIPSEIGMVRYRKNLDSGKTCIQNFGAVREYLS